MFDLSAFALFSIFIPGGDKSPCHEHLVKNERRVKGKSGLPEWPAVGRSRDGGSSFIFFSATRILVYADLIAQGNELRMRTAISRFLLTKTESLNMEVLAASRSFSGAVILAKEGLSFLQPLIKCLDGDFHRSDGLLGIYP